MSSSPLLSSEKASGVDKKSPHTPPPRRRKIQNTLLFSGVFFQKNRGCGQKKTTSRGEFFFTTSPHLGFRFFDSHAEVWRDLGRWYQGHRCLKQMSNEKNPALLSMSHTGCLIGILTWVSYNPYYITGSIIPYLRVGLLGYIRDDTNI